MVSINGDRYTIGPKKWKMRRGHFPLFLAKHAQSDPITRCIEEYAAQYVADGFPKDRTKALVSAVCRWGGNQRQIASRVLKNKPRSMRLRFSVAHQALLNGDPRAAIDTVTEVKNLGLSYGSKHLKFLCPTHAVVLDGVIRKKLGYPETPNGFLAFLADCGEIRDDLNANHVPTGAAELIWRVSDVEMAIFAKVKKL